MLSRLSIASALLATAAICACSSPGETVIVQQPAPSSTTPGTSHVDAGSDAAVDASADAEIDADAAVTPTCSGPAAQGNAVNDCTPSGPCSLSTCEDGITYLCHDANTGTSAEQGGWPVGVASYFSNQDSQPGVTGFVNCALPQCVHRVYSDPGVTIAVWSCPAGMMPAEPGKTCTEFGEGTVWGKGKDPRSATATVYRCY